MAIVYLLWPPCGFPIFRDGSESVFSVGNGVSHQLMTGFSTSLDIEEVLSRARDDKLHVTVADVFKSFDTVDRSMLELWTWHAEFASMVSACLFFSSRARCALGFGLAAGLGALWCRDGGILQGCPLSMVFVVALYVPWRRRLAGSPGIGPHLMWTKSSRVLVARRLSLMLPHCQVWQNGG